MPHTGPVTLPTFARILLALCGAAILLVSGGNPLALTAPAVPEPASVLLLGAGLLALAGQLRRLRSTK